MKYRLRNKYTTDPEVALEEILRDRGVTDIENFMNPSPACELNPYLLKNIEAAADRLLYHLHKGSSILFNVDADCDGFTSSAILWLYIKHIFPEANLHFMVHTHKQHGLDDKIDWLEDNPDYDLILCPDSSSYDKEEHRRLGELGIDVIVLDHHEQEFDQEGNPVISDSPNTIIVNNQLSPYYSNKSLCGAGIVYKFCEVLDEILGIDQAHNYIDLAALGEIADVMDRTDIETNYIMTEGLRHIRNEGFRTLLQAQSFSLKEKAVPPYHGLTPIDIAFYIAPLINAITRVGTMEEKETMFYCFIEPNRPMKSTKRGAKSGDIEYAAEQTARVGKNAKARQDRIKEQALGIVDFKIQKDCLDENNIILVELDASDNIPQELTGLIAMNVVSKYHKPVMIGRRNGDNELQGSIRSDENFAGLPNFKKFLEDSKLLNYTAGHDNACGWGLNGSRVDSLINYANSHLSASDFENCYIADYILKASDYNERLLASLASHPEYFGNHIEEIKIVVEDIPLTNVMTMGANKDSMKISYNGIDYVHFKDTDFIDEVTSDRTKKLTIYGRCNLNEWMGRKSVQVFIDDYELKEDNSKYEF
jgi:single-stranded-DNA-specific exonuclease